LGGLDVETVEVIEEVDQVHQGLAQFDYVQHPDGHLLRWDLAEPFINENL